MSEPPATSSVVLSRQDMLWWGVILLLIGGLLGAGIVHLLRPVATDSAMPAGPLPVIGTVSDFALVDSAGEAVVRDDLAGRVWVADFFFTSCAGICPMMSKRMAELQTALAGVDEVTLVSISVDPERDTPERLRRYAKKYDADPVRWWFLTGDKRAIYRLSQESFHLGVEEAPVEGREPDMEDVLHSSRFVLLDRRARIRGYYDGEEPATVERLAADIRRLLKEQRRDMRIVDLPHVNVALNALSAVLLTAGYVAIKRRRIDAHRRLMIAAMAVSAAFLVSYLTYHFGVELTRKYTGEWRTLYYIVLPIHVLGAMVNLPMVIVTAVRAFRGDFVRHRRIARVTLPLWWFVSVTGVIVYGMLY